MAYNQAWVNLIRTLAPRYGIDPRAALAVASREGLSGGVGDGGHAFGPFQLNDAAGVITNRPGNHRAFAESPQGIMWALQQIGQVARGLHGRQAVNAIVSRFERPANPSAEIQGALSAYNQFGGPTPPAGAASPPTPMPPLAAAGTRALLGRALLGAAQTGDYSGFFNTLRSTRAQPAQPMPRATGPGLAQTQAGASTPAAGGYPAMTPGRPIKVPGLTAAPQADWTHVDSRLIRALSTVAQRLRVTVQIISGYRSPGYSAGVGGYSTDPHTRGVAVDAYINGVPIGNYPGAKQLLARLGLESGAQPGFYRGKTDPEHVQIPGSGVNKTIRARSYYR